MSTIWTFVRIKHKHTLYRGKDFMKTFWKSFREEAKNIIYFEKKMVAVVKRRTKIKSRCKSILYSWKTNLRKALKSINNQRVRDHCHYTGKYRSAAYSIGNLKLNVPNEIPVAFHNSSKYYYLFIILIKLAKELANNFQEKFYCLGENTEKYKTFPVPIEKKVTNIDKDGNESIVTISPKMRFIDSARFMAI